MTVGDLLSRADSRELSEWQALFLHRQKESLRRELDTKALQGADRIKSMKQGA